MVSNKSVEEILAGNKWYSYVKTDRNGTRYFATDRCERCGGTGFIACYNFIDGGRCYECGGSGRSKVRIEKVYTEEHWAKLCEQREKRAAKKAEERVAKAEANRGTMLEKFGFGHEDEWVLYRIVGDTYAIKDELKEAGCHFNPAVGWYGAQVLEGYECQRMAAADVLTDNIFSVEFRPREEVRPMWVETQRAKEASPSQWIGQVGDRIEITVTVDRSFDSSYSLTSWRTINSTMYLMHDEAGNIYKWSTASYHNEGDTMRLRATIKDHTEYNGIKQTVVTRCKEI